MARTKLRGVKLNEVSLVGKGDNPEAHILLLKTHPNVILEKSLGYKGADKVVLLQKWYVEQVEKGNLKKDAGEAVLFSELESNRELRDKLWSLVYMLEDSICSITEDETVTDKKGMIAESINQFQTTVTGMVKGENMTPEELQKQLDEAKAKIASLEKEKGTLQSENDVLKKKTAAMVGMTDQEIADMKAKMKKEKQEEIDKSALPESVRKHLEEVEKQNKENAAEIAKMKEEAITKECIEKATSIPAAGKVDDISVLLKDITKANPELATRVFDVLKTADERIKKGGLFTEIGKESGEEGLTVADKLDKLAKEYAEKNNVTYAKAYDHVYQTNHELRKEYNASRR